LRPRAETGFLIPAIGDVYVQCAERLRSSILNFHPDADVTIVTAEMLPYGDQTGYANDWQCWYVSPYRETIKLEADMLITSPIDHWWTMLRHRDVVITTGCNDFYGNRSISRFYRRVFDQNNLPDVYNAITYWRLSNTAKEFFKSVRAIFENWDKFKTILKLPPEEPDTDLVYAMAAEIIGREKVTLPDTTYPRITHMKKHIIGTRTDDWTNEIVAEVLSDCVRINTVNQWGALHYHIKDWQHEQQ
jgi:hypothetical protein